MAAAVAVAPVPFKDEDDDSSDDDFADELEAQLFEAEVKRDAVTGVKREREGRDEEPSAKRVVRDAGRREEQHDGREGLATLPLELTLQILRWLSPEDLTSVGTTCKAMAFATADDSLWRRCFCSRFGHPKLTGVRSWRALYFQEDARELRLTTSSAPPDLRHLYAQMQAAKRAQPPETHDDALLTLTDAENVTRWRAQRGLSGVGPRIPTHVLHRQRMFLSQIRRGHIRVRGNGPRAHVRRQLPREGGRHGRNVGDVLHLGKIVRQVSW